jgi:asparagine synthase (glutamine-hydrolysing)
VKVALTGDGGDELFLGYKGLIKQRLARRLRYAPALSRQMAARIVGGQADVPRRFNKYLRLSLLDDAGLIIEWCRRWEWSQLEDLLGIEMTRQLFPSRVELFPEIRDLIQGSEAGGFLEQQSRFHMLVDLPCDMLFKVDRMSMAHGLEVRVPILSNDMLEYGSHLPMAARSRKSRTKEPLRTLAETLSPTVATPSSKHGFAFPMDLWMRAKLGAYWQEWGLTSSLEDIGMQGDEVNRLVTSYTSVGPVTQNYNTGSLSGRLFDLMLLAIWLDRYDVKA